MREAQLGTRRPVGGLALPVAGLGAGALGGYLIVSAALPLLHNRMLPWLLGRGLGLAAYLALTCLVGLGTWYRHPWRLRRPMLHPVRQLRMHATLALVTLALTSGHVLALVADRYARVGWSGALLPGDAAYRPLAVALGTLALYLGLVVGATAALGRRHWLPIHRIAVISFGLVWFHGVFAGADAPALRGFYLLTGGIILALAVSRRLARPPHPVAPTRSRRLVRGPLA